ncbi:MAG: hypothetical protein ABI140_17485 [Jatrophihabitantaceae bacterium]
MSGGAITVVPVGLLIALPIAALIGAGVAAVLVIRAAAAGTGAAGRLLEHLGEQMLCLADAQDDAAIRTRLWEVAAGAVVQTNQELCLLAARAERVGMTPTLPPPIDLAGCRLADTRALVVQAQEAIASARVEVVRAEVAHEKREMLANVAAAMGDPSAAAERLAAYQKTLDLRVQPGTDGPPPRKVDKSRVRAQIERVLLRLDLDAMTGDRQRVLATAAVAEEQSTPAASRTYLDALSRLVDEELNPLISRRREAAALLAGLEHPVVTELIGELPHEPPVLPVIERLRAVVRGEMDLTDQDRGDGQRVLSSAAAELERRRLLEGISEAFAGLGYSVSTGLQVHHRGALSVTRPSWYGEHTADVWIDEAGDVQSRLVQVAPDAAGEAARCADLNTSMHRVADQLLGRGFDSEVALPARAVPAVKRLDHRIPPKPPVEVTKPAPREIDPR